MSEVKKRRAELCIFATDRPACDAAKSSVGQVEGYNPGCGRKDETQ